MSNTNTQIQNNSREYYSKLIPLLLGIKDVLKYMKDNNILTNDYLIQYLLIYNIYYIRCRRCDYIVYCKT